MKIGIFSDSHYSSHEVTEGSRLNNQSLNKIKKAYEYFQEENCDLAVCLGDLIDTESTVEKEIENLRQIANVMSRSSVPTVCIMGNHDAFTLTPEQFYSVLGFEEPKSLHVNGVNLVFLDACYFKSGVHYAPGDSDWEDTFYPFAEELKAELQKYSEPTYIFVHQSLDPAIEDIYRLFNSEDIFNVIAESGVVKTVFQGHYHHGMRSEYDGVKYITIKSMCEHDDSVEIFEL